MGDVAVFPKRIVHLLFSVLMTRHCAQLADLTLEGPQAPLSGVVTRMAPPAHFFDLGNVFRTSNGALPGLAGDYAKLVGFEEERGDIFAGYGMFSKCLELLEAVLCEDQVDFWDHVS